MKTSFENYSPPLTTTVSGKVRDAIERELALYGSHSPLIYMVSGEW
jgi:hypothetical protein